MLKNTRTAMRSGTLQRVCKNGGRLFHSSARFESANVLAIGKGEPCTVMSSYGYRNVVSMEEYVEHFKDIDPLAKYKKWSTNNDIRKNTKNVYSSNKAIDAVFVVSDPVDWGRDIQVLCDVLRSGGYPGRSAGNQPYLYFAADDLEYQAAFPVERLGMGAFRIALESIYNGISKTPLVYTSFGKPSVPVFRGSEIALLKLAEIVKPDVKHGNFARLYMIGDNPYTDILGAKQAGAPWFSILTRTGCFKGEDNHDQYKADLVVDDVLEAVQYIMKEHKIELLQH
ncbi:hypothetical protein KP509_21G080400 [Ceratopteris richardii]|uniref:Uncharacterized protein n=1 Tax=Ceratopteris richardii TaxID=49495 RepID=A0A8T2SES8_CERRI|nr:hypothetical protein KP509_21G080400 [Ceratopteris richardii]